MKNTLLATSIAAALVTLTGAATAQSNVVIYGRVDQSIAQQADAVKNREMRPGSGNRLGFRGTEDLGGGLKAVFQIEHRFNADDGTANSIFWAGKALVGIESSFGRFWLGRDENPAYLLAQNPADPWGTDTVAANTTIIKGRIGSQRYNNSLNYAISMSGFSFGAQVAEADGNVPGVDSGSVTGGVATKRPYSLGLGYKAGALQLGLGYENPADADDDWTTVFAAYNFGPARLGAFFGTGTNANAQKHDAWLLSATAPIGSGELRLSYGQLKNKNVSVNPIKDKQLGLGYHYALSKRTTLYTDFTNERRDGMAANLEKNGWDFGIKHNF